MAAPRDLKGDALALEAKLSALLSATVPVSIGSLPAGPRTLAPAPHAAVTADLAQVRKGLDRVAGAIEWLCLWPTTKSTLSGSLASIDIREGPISKADAAVDTSGGGDARVALRVVYSPVLGFPGANSVARALDEALSLYRGRLEDIRRLSLAEQEAELRSVAGPRARFALNVEALSRMDWEGDNFFNAYTELCPSSAPLVLGRLPRAVASVAARGSDYDRFVIADALRGVELSVTLDPSPSCHFDRASGILHVRERLWLGPELPEDAIAAELHAGLRLGRDFNAAARRIADAVVPRFEARLETRIDVDWDTLVPGACPDPPAAAETIEGAGSSSACLERIAAAIAECEERYPLARERYTESLAGIRIARAAVRRCAIVAAAADGSAAKNGGGAGGAADDDAAGLVLVVEAPWERGRAQAPSVDEIGDALRDGLRLRRAPEGLDGFNVTDIYQTGRRVELQGDISSVEAFNAVFDILTGYTARTLQVQREEKEKEKEKETEREKEIANGESHGGSGQANFPVFVQPHGNYPFSPHRRSLSPPLIAAHAPMILRSPPHY